MKPCSDCGDLFEAKHMVDGTCRFCVRNKKFAAFARECGLEAFPDPSGERYIYNLDGSLDGKKSECIGFMDELWNALVRARGGDESLMI